MTSLFTSHLMTDFTTPFIPLQLKTDFNPPSVPLHIITNFTYWYASVQLHIITELTLPMHNYIPILPISVHSCCAHDC